MLAAELRLLNGNTSRADRLLLNAPPREFSALLPRYEMLRGYSLSRHKRYLAAQESLNQAIADATAQGDTETQVDAWLHLGTAHVSRGDLPLADADFRQAQALAEAHRFVYQQAAALSNRGGIQIRLERYGDAIPLLEAARELANRAGIRPISALARANLANCYESLGDTDQALALLQSSVEEQKKLGLATSLSNDYSELGVIYLQKGDTANALRHFHLAFEAVNKDAPVQYSLAAGNLANALEQRGSLDEAARFNAIAFRFADSKNEAIIGSLTIGEANIAERRGQHTQAIALYQKAIEAGKGVPSILWQAYAGLGAAYAANGNFFKASESYAKALKIISANRANQLKTDYKITFLSNLIRFYQDYVALLIEHGDIGHALEIADSSRAGVLTEDLLSQQKAMQPALLPQIQKAARATHTVFLFYWLAPQRSYLWAIGGPSAKAVALADQKQITQDVASYRSLIEQEKRDPLLNSSQAGARLYQELLAPVADLIPSGTRVVIVPDGPLHNLNFETLLVPAPKPHYWIEDVTLSVAPSLGILAAATGAAPAHLSLLLIGDPVTQGTGYPPLPQAGLEIAAILRQFVGSHPAVLTGPRAVVDAYANAQPAKFSTIHFATHVDANAQSPLDSAIILSPRPNGFKLYARDVARIPLNAELVTISACRGAGARNFSGEGLVGFAWAFFQARAQNVVTSLWDVYDTSTAQLMADFYASIQAGHPYASALREAKLKMVHSHFQRPYYWAPFQLYSRTIAAASVHRFRSSIR